MTGVESFDAFLVKVVCNHVVNFACICLLFADWLNFQHETSFDVFVFIVVNKPITLDHFWYLSDLFRWGLILDDLRPIWSDFAGFQNDISIRAFLSKVAYKSITLGIVVLGCRCVCVVYWRFIAFDWFLPLFNF